MQTRNHTMQYNGFHGRATITVRVPVDTRPGQTVTVSRAVARRVNAAVCGIAGCCCGEQVAHEQYPDSALWSIDLPEDGQEMGGYYPQ